MTGIARLVANKPKKEEVPEPISPSKSPSLVLSSPDTSIVTLEDTPKKEHRTWTNHSVGTSWVRLLYQNGGSLSDAEEPDLMHLPSHLLVSQPSKPRMKNSLGSH
ncbi:hypothetical protein SKAU_G00123140 [Synaphobranchus kaupii]|uniref:Uncharacterized protein n=1 Tax=Synaphobranchus kaupii TaxID=118154 RepID=A0A9Q1J2L5_SYNKA|nr:hypothetical protein SKAU_G00123140 [Synaphobranchus kaupii]